MKRIYLFLLITVAFISCAPVLREEVMKAGSTEVPFNDITSNPDSYRGRLFILGGIIVSTRLTDRGSLIEAAYIQVDSRGYLQYVDSSHGRFLALYPRQHGILEPLVYKSGRKVTLAGEFIETRAGKIDEMDYVYPVFLIKELYLWEDQTYYAPPYNYYPYWWWGYPYYYRGYSPYWFGYYSPYPYWW